jgi:hypothetical protein
VALCRKPAPHPGVLFTKRSPPGGRISGAGRWFIQTGADNGPDFSFVDVMCYVGRVVQNNYTVNLHHESVNMTHLSVRIKQSKQKNRHHNTMPFYSLRQRF